MKIRAGINSFKFKKSSAAIGLAAGYFALAELGLRWATVSGEAASPVFPAAGLALAGLVLGGVRLWPAVFVGRMAAFLLGGASLPLWADLSMAAGVTLAAIAGFKMLQWASFDPRLRRLRDVLALITATLGSTFLSAVVGTGVLAAALGQGSAQAWDTLLNWWAGDLTGVLIVTPLVLSWVLGEPVGRNPRWWLHLVLSTVVAGIATWMIFGPLDLPLLRTFPLFPVLIWAALAGGVRCVATAMVPVAVIAIWGTTMGYGPVATEAAEHTALRFVLLQEFIGLAAMTGLALAVVADERRGKEATERKRVEEALQESEEHLRLIMANVKDHAIFTIGIDGKITSWSAGAERVFGYTVDEILGQAASVLFTPEDRASNRHQIEMELAADTGFAENERWHIRKDGTRFFASGSMEGLRDESRHLRGFVKIIRDITEWKKLEEQRERLLENERHARTEAERANTLKEEFLATISHELRTPLHAILGWSQILDQRKDADTLDKALSAVKRNARAQAQLVDDLLDMSRIVTGKIRLDVQSVSLHDVVTAAIETVRPAAEAKEIRIQQVLDPKAGPVRGDPNRLQQVVWNLLSNAVKFTPKRGQVQVALERINSHVEVTVTDTGQGIEPEFLPFVFDRFRQADGSTSRQYGGLGLGLSIVEHLVELHGGRVRAHSSGKEQGSTFVIELPLAIIHQLDKSKRIHPTGSSFEPPQIEPGEGLSLHGVTVLAVDDEPDALAILRYVLENYDARVLTAESATQALDVLRKEQPDVLLSDIGMPDMDGYELIRRVRALGPGEGGLVPAAALTAFARSTDRTRSVLAGYQMHLTKPVPSDELIAIVSSLAGLAGKARVQ